MSNSSSESQCPVCGAELEVCHQGSAQGLFCTVCDWSIVTTALREILCDETSYEISVTSGDFKNQQHLKLVAHLAGTNLISARKLLRKGDAFDIFVGHAKEASSVKDELTLAKIEFKIKPSFPW